MARVKILADSTCDLTPALLRQYDITLTPLVVIKDGQQFHDGVDITPADIFAHVDAGGKLCSTAAVSEYEYTQMFARFVPDYDTVIQITIGSGFSACYQNACLAAQAFENVIVIDSENLSTGQGLLVIAAARLAEQGLTGEEIAALTSDLSTGLSRLQDALADVQVIFDDAQNAFDGMQLPETDDTEE